jgi:CubicO group peptidase (beta-lactamase class C family)
MTMLDKNDTKAMTARFDAAMDKAIAEKRIVGTVLVIGINGETVYQRAAGMIDREAGAPMREDAIFRMASCTKPIVAATALAMVDKGLIGLDDDVSRHVPDFRPQWEGKPAGIKVRHLLTHTSGLSYDQTLLDEVGASPGMRGPLISLEENARRIGGMKLKFAPGTRWEYGVSIDVLGAVVAKINRSTLGEAVETYVTGPLGMKDTRFGVADPTRLAVPYGDGKPEPLRMGDPHTVTSASGSTMFIPSRSFNPLAPQSGGSGMTGTALDFAKFLEMLRSGGGRILKPETVKAGLSNQIGSVPRREKDVGKRFGFFGAVVDDPVAANTPMTRGTAEWGGVYGHHWILDAASGVAMTSYSNTAIEGSDGAYRYELIDAIYGASR